MDLSGFYAVIVASVVYAAALLVYNKFAKAEA